MRGSDRLSGGGEVVDLLVKEALDRVRTGETTEADYVVLREEIYRLSREAENNRDRTW